MSSIWSQLGVEPTHDIRTIKRAYQKRLRSLDLQRDIDDFQLLRAAYESALNEARSSDSDHIPTPKSRRSRSNKARDDVIEQIKSALLSHDECTAIGIFEHYLERCKDPHTEWLFKIRMLRFLAAWQGDPYPRNLAATFKRFASHELNDVHFAELLGDCLDRFEKRLGETKLASTYSFAGLLLFGFYGLSYMPLLSMGLFRIDLYERWGAWGAVSSFLASAISAWLLQATGQSLFKMRRILGLYIASRRR